MRDLFRLDGRTAVVVGGGGGIGQAVAGGLAFYGARVAVAGRSRGSIEAAAAAIAERTGCEIAAYPVDVTDEESVRRLAETAEAELGGVDIIVNSQGVNIKKAVFDMTPEEWDRTFSVNARGVMLCSVAFSRAMCARGHGRIITISSIRAHRAAFGEGYSLAYSSSKGAVGMFTRQLAAELAGRGVTVNEICPAATRTAAADKTAELIPDIEKRMIAKIPLGRMAVPDDIIGAAVLLASDAGAFITGTSIYIDGGMSCVG